MSNWQRIRLARTDLTDFVIHLTSFVVEWDHKERDVKEGIVRLKEILKAGFLIPTSAPRYTRNKQRVKTIHGHKAVCYSDQPLDQVLITLREAGGAKYQGYGIAVHKVDLFNYGGRPVMYGDRADLARLHEDMRHLWVHYRPLRPGVEYPNDFTFEREWRCRPAPRELVPWGHDLDGVPLLLPDDFNKVAFFAPKLKCWFFRRIPLPDFRIIVGCDMDVQPIVDFISTLQAGPIGNNYMKIYYAALGKAQIISLEHITRKLEEGDDDYRRIETLPFLPESPHIVPANPKKKEWPWAKVKEEP